MKKGFPTVVKSPPRPHPRPIRIAFTDVNGVVDPRTVRSFCEHKELQSELSEGNSNADSIPTPKRATKNKGDGLTAYEREREVRTIATTTRRDGERGNACAGHVRTQTDAQALDDDGQERVRRNEELLTQLRVRETARALAVVAEPTKRARLATKRRAAELAPIEPTRRSARARGAKAKAMEIGEDDQIVDGEEGLEHHLTCDEYCERLGIEPGPKMTSFTGWVEESVRERLGIASSANEAWERNGGGKWSRPAKGQAKDHAKKMLYKNPNAYFYRHTAGEEQINGDWSEDEIKQFVKVATKYGAGDKWGLFASHIPGRVGYQCSAAYRHIMLPRGLLRDDAWRMTMSGEAVWIGKR